MIFRIADPIYTLGLTFWKSPRRKLYAVPIEDLNAVLGIDYCETGDRDMVGGSTPRGRKRSASADWSNSEKECPEVKRTVEQIDTKVDFIMTDIQEIKSRFEENIKLTKDTPIPVGLKKSKDHFKCRICLTSPLNPPVVITKCCRVILGCERCVNGWFVGQDALTKGCPSCRIERGYGETMVLRGIDDFLEATKPLQEVAIGND